MNGVIALDTTYMTAQRMAELRRVCIEEGLIDEDDLLDLNDIRIISA